MTNGGDGGPGGGEPRSVVGIVVIAYEAEATIDEVLDRLPEEVHGGPPAVLVADDASTDRTAVLARRWAATRPGSAEVVRRPRNLGYGGNQMAGYQWAIERDLVAVACVHGDAQYPPEAVPELIAPLLSGEADAVFGSRMIDRGGARLGGMPLTRRVGNRVLSGAQNLLTGERLSEWHSGLRAYRCDTLDAIGLEGLPSGFDFDTAITLRLIEHDAAFSEIAIPTRYAGEVSYIDPWSTGVRILGHTLRHRLRRR
jgi:glycosyltransferase involved in cell wall biosynthesis